jgi:hypothetical protein
MAAIALVQHQPGGLCCSGHPLFAVNRRTEFLGALLQLREGHIICFVMSGRAVQLGCRWTDVGKI